MLSVWWIQGRNLRRQMWNSQPLYLFLYLRLSLVCILPFNLKRCCLLFWFYLVFLIIFICFFFLSLSTFLVGLYLNSRLLYTSGVFQHSVLPCWLSWKANYSFWFTTLILVNKNIKSVWEMLKIVYIECDF